MILDFGFWVLDSRFIIEGEVFRVLGLGLGFRIWGLGFRV
jgi:hypothetical protein